MTIGLTALFSASAGTINQSGDLWIAESNGILNISPQSGDVQFEIPHTLGISGVAVNDVSGDLWAYGKKRLYRYGRSGQPLLDVATPPNTHGGDPVDLVVDGFSGNLWLGIKSELYRFDLEGRLQQTLRTPREIRALALDRSRSVLWVGMEQQVLLYDPEGRQVKSINLSAKENLADLAYDRHLNQVWIALASSLRRYDTDGGLVFERASDYSGSIAPDGSGGLWQSRDLALRHLDHQGSATFSTEPFAGDPDKTIVDLVADPQDASIWVASQRQVRHYAIDGELMDEPSLQLHDGVIRRLFRASLYADLDPPEIKFNAPASGSLLNNNRPTLELEYFDLGVGVDADTLKLNVNGQPLAAACTTTAIAAQCVPNTDLPEGELLLAATIADRAGNISEPAELRITVDTVPPVISVAQPPQDSITNRVALTIRGSLNESGALTINSTPVALNGALEFNFETQLVEGANAFVLAATDRAGNSSLQTLHVTLDTAPPAIPQAGLITVSALENGQVTVTGAAGSVEPGVSVRITNPRTGQVVTVIANADGSFVAQIAAEGGDQLQIRAQDAASNSSDATDLPVSAGSGLPPDPATVAPPLSQTEITPFHESTAFLYTGANPIQTGVAPGTITPIRAAVIRGKVLGRDNAPVTGMTITVKGHPEFGQTLSRADGMFDMAVNGGGVVTLNYTKNGYLPVQRQENTPWRDFVMLPDVVMIGLDNQVTTVDLSAAAAIQLARGNPVTDSDGSRQATLMFTQGTTAQMVMPDGSTRPMTTLNVRATEYTVGANGPKTMPGPLPPTSGYTYAVELSADEAIAAGAKSVQFNKPVWLYVENFLNFPVGMAVPTGWYDRDKAAWIPSQNGRVIKILEVQDGQAVLSAASSGQPATPAELSVLGVTNEERASLAQTYSTGQMLWRMPITHFTPWDGNWPAGPPLDAEPPELPMPKGDDEVDRPGCKSGSIIECQNQVLGETIPIAGTGFTLNYRSDRVLGRAIAYSLDIPISGATVPATLQRIELHINIAGKTHELDFPAQPNRRYQFVWDGKDAFGRPVNGAQPATVSIGHVYDPVYYGPANTPYSFNRLGNTIITGVLARGEFQFSLNQDSKSNLGIWDARAVGLAGWTLPIHHAYDPIGQVLYRGDGTKLGAKNLNAAIRTVAGVIFEFFPHGENVPATKALLNPTAVVAAPDGSFYIAESHRIRKVGPDGTIRTFAGSGTFGFNGDGGLATQASLWGPAAIALGPDGSLYITDSGNHRIRRVGADGIISTVAGNGSPGFTGDEGLATQASLENPRGIAVASDGSFYVSDSSNHRVRRVGTDGVISTVAGNDSQSIDQYGNVQRYSGDGGPATQAGLYLPTGLALGPDGSL